MKTVGDQLRRLLMEGSVHPACRRVAEVWYWERSEKDQERALRATEDAAAAARTSAQSSIEAARWAGGSLLISVVGLVIALLTYSAYKT